MANSFCRITRLQCILGFLQDTSVPDTQNVITVSIIETGARNALSRYKVKGKLGRSSSQLLGSGSLNAHPPVVPRLGLVALMAAVPSPSHTVLSSSG